MKSPPWPELPIQTILPKLQKKIQIYNSVVLAAEPGSGKTTIVPLALLHEPWLAGKKIIMLEPRRLAARMAAQRLSELVGDKVGGLVGYRIRFARKISSKTRLEVVTEGILTRLIQSDPDLTNIGLVIFDEFHLRSLQTDLALALTLDVQQLRDDLKIMIMSATMDCQRISHLLGDAPIVRGQGRCFPVTSHFLPRPSQDYLVPRTVKAIHRVLTEHKGDILVFLPGVGEIKGVQKRIQGDFLCLPLYGNLPQKKQDKIFAQPNQRRVILATPIAETSLTIQGIRVVIDSGLMKTPRFSPSTGLTTLHTVTISKASAEQRAGRAGRLGPGVCYRLWTKAEDFSRPDFLTPEIIDADLTPLLLALLQWGVTDPGQLTWLDPPRPSQLKQAKTILNQLGALNKQGLLNEIGRQLATLPLHPRLGLMLLRGRDRGHGALACQLAALLQNRDLLADNDKEGSADIEDRLEILRLFSQQGGTMVQARNADPNLCRRILQEARQYQRLLNITGTVDSFQEAGTLLAHAYPDRLARQKPGAQQHQLSSGRGVKLAKGDHLHHAEFLVAAQVDGGKKKQGHIFMAAAISRQEIIAEHGHLLHRKEQVRWEKTRVTADYILHLGRLELERKPLTDIAASQMMAALLDGIRQAGIACLGWQQKSRDLQARMASAHDLNPDYWPDVSDDSLEANLSWLAPYLAGISTLKQLKKIDPYPILLSLLSWPDQQELDRLLPTHFQVPSGSQKRLLYQPGKSPILSVRLQEMFGATTTPTVFAGKVPILIHLLSPASRPIQITKDLAGFWANTYQEVKKELKGRYPKHYWPDDPLSAPATRHVRPKKH